MGATGRAQIEFWWTEAGSYSTRPHELHHVGILKASFRDAFDLIAWVTGKCLCKPKAECYKMLGRKLWEVLDARQTYENDDYDCNDYGDRYGACSRKGGELQALKRKVAELFALSERCEKIQD